MTNLHRTPTLIKRWALALAVALILGVIFPLGQVTKVIAQNARRWSDPQNLSRSGSARNPMIISQPNGDVYAFWNDPFGGYQYSMKSTGAWSASASAGLPKELKDSARKVAFISAPSGRIYIVWVDTKFQLNYSYTQAGADKTLGGWQTNKQLYTNVVDFNADIDSGGNIHIVFLLGEDTTARPAGIYYIRVGSNDALISFLPLDQSPYYRVRLALLSDPNAAASQPKATMAVKSLITGSVSRVFASWSNPQTRQMFLRQSSDNGMNWDTVQEIPNTSQSTIDITLGNPEIGTIGQTIFLFWRASQKNISCVQYFQYSDDGGVKWSERKQLFSEIGVCAETNQLLSENNQAALFSTINTQEYISIWNGQAFLPAMAQKEVTSFTDPGSSNIIQLGCQQAAWAGDQIFVIGCGTAGTSDVWVFSQPVQAVFSPSSLPVTWSAPKQIALEQYPVNSLNLLADGRTNMVHVFWSQPSSGITDGIDDSIFYTNWSSLQSRSPAPILRSASGKTSQPTVTLDSTGRMFVVWSGGKTGELFFSWSAAENANSTMDWYVPVAIPSPRLAAMDPIIKVDANGILYIAYLIPLNEARGVYLTRSTDRGATWSEPAHVFDAVSGNCDMVGNLSMAITSSGSLHLSWVCETIPGGTGPYALRYARSKDSGTTWDVLPDEKDRQVTWSTITDGAKNSLHRIWQETGADRQTLYDQVSYDDGDTWSSPSEVSFSDTRTGPVNLGADPAGQLYLSQIAQQGKNLVLNFWKWDGANWRSGEAAVLREGQISQIETFTTEIIPNGMFVAAYAFQSFDAVQGTNTSLIEYTSYPVVIPAGQGQATAKAVATIAPKVGITATPAATNTPLPTPTVNLAALPPDQAGRSSNTTTIILGAVIGISLVAAVLFMQIRKRNQ